MLWREALKEVTKGRDQASPVAAAGAVAKREAESETYDVLMEALGENCGDGREWIWSRKCVGECFMRFDGGRRQSRVPCMRSAAVNNLFSFCRRDLEDS